MVREMTKTFKAETVENGYVIYVDDKLMKHWEVEKLLNDLYFQCREQIRTIYSYENLSINPQVMIKKDHSQADPLAVNNHT